jgi:hypothetical protein
VYWATLEVDYSAPHDSDQRNLLTNALVHLGWTYAETSVLVYAGESLNVVRTRSRFSHARSICRDDCLH